MQHVALADPAISALTLRTGRVFVAADTAQGAAEVAIISAALGRLLADRTDIIGRTVTVSGRSVVVVGIAEVAPPDQAAVRLWLLVRR